MENRKVYEDQSFSWNSSENTPNGGVKCKGVGKRLSHGWNQGTLDMTLLPRTIEKSSNLLIYLLTYLMLGS